MGLMLAEIGHAKEGIAKIDSVIDLLSHKRKFNEMDATIIALKRKENVLDHERRYRDDGTWARFEPGDESEPFNMSAFRGYFEVEDDGSSASRLRAAALPGTYKTLFQSNNRQGTTTGENLNYENLGYEATIPYTNSTTGIEPTLNAVDADGVHYYFDLLGRPLREKPEQGIYIDNGQKVITE